MKTSKALILTIILYLTYKMISDFLPMLIGNYENYLETFDSYPFDNIRGFSFIFGLIFTYLLMFKLLRVKKVNFEKIKKWRNYNLAPIMIIIAIGIGLQLLNDPIFNFSKIISHYSTNNETNFDFQFQPNLKFIYTCISYLILSPILEELFFRRMLFVRLKEKLSRKFSIILSSICFSIIHIDEPRNLFPTLILGLVCAIVYDYSKKIEYSILLHLTYNLYWFITIIEEDYINWKLDLQYNLTYWIIALIGLILIIGGINKIRKLTPYKINVGFYS